MNWTNHGPSAEVTALLICADAQLSAEFQAAIGAARAFQILGEMNGYPAEQALDLRLNQYSPQVVMIDVASDLETAIELIQYLVASGRDVAIAGLHRNNDSGAILKTLRAGASEFLYAPFDVSTQKEAASRLQRMTQSGMVEMEDREFAGHLVAFSSTKPGSGSSTLAAQTAFALQRVTNGRVLLADFDLMGGAIGFYLKLEHRCSLIEVMEHAEHLDAGNWAAIAEPCGGIEVLPAPVSPYAGPLDMNRLAVALDSARRCFDWVVVDLPMIFHRMSMMTAVQSERVMLVTTPELPSLHLARKSVSLLEQIGLPKERVNMLVNRVSKWDGLGTADFEKLFNCPVFATLPNDYFSLHRVITLGQALGTDAELGRAVEAFATKLAAPGAASSGKRAVPDAAALKPSPAGVR